MQRSRRFKWLYITSYVWAENRGCILAPAAPARLLHVLGILNARRRVPTGRLIHHDSSGRGGRSCAPRLAGSVDHDPGRGKRGTRSPSLRTGVPDGAHAVVAAGRMLHSWQNIPRRSLLQLVSLLRHKFDWGGAMPSKRALRMCQQCHRDLCWRNSSYPGEIGRTVWNWYLCGRLMLY